MYRLSRSGIKKQMFRNKTSILIINARLKWLLNSARMFSSPILLFGLLVGFRSLEQNLLRHAFPKPLKFFLHKWLTRSSLKSSSTAITGLIAHLYLNLALIPFSLNTPHRGQPFKRQILVCSIHFRSSSPGVRQCFSTPTLTSGTQRLEALNKHFNYTIIIVF